MIVLRLLIVLIGGVFSCSGLFCSDRYNQYLYPVDMIMHEGKEQLLLLLQVDAQHLKLYRYDFSSRILESELFSLYNPAGVRVLPCRSAYSFIDQGRVRIKDSLKRSPATIDFDIPIYDISIMHWIDDEAAYCHAREGHRFGVYTFTRDGAVNTIVHDPESDYLFPSKVDNVFFCIQRVDEVYSICSIDGKKKLLNTVFCYDHQPIAFLHMDSLERGYVLVHQMEIKDGQQVVSFAYDVVERLHGVWSKKTLFTFQVPIMLLDRGNDNALYEGILPLLPYHNNQYIYYGSAAQNASEFLWFCYDIQLGASALCNNYKKQSDRFFLRPIQYNSRLIFGGILTQQKSDDYFDGNYLWHFD